MFIYLIIHVYFRFDTSNLEGLAKLPNVSNQLKDEITKILQERNKGSSDMKKKTTHKSSSSSSDSSDDNK